MHPLNELCRSNYLSVPQNSVAVMKLAKYHTVKSQIELERLISSHRTGNCACGAISKGTVKDFGGALFEAQMPTWGEVKYTLKECEEWMYDLFITKTLKGLSCEEKAVAELQSRLKTCTIALTYGEEDEVHRVDLNIVNNALDVCKIQVKPFSNKSIPSEVQSDDTSAHSELGVPVYYLYYDGDCLFLEMDELTQKIEQMLI